jgi:hypothetical protein
MMLAKAVTRLYRILGRWQRVANECAARGATPHSAGYYQQIARERIKQPNAATAKAIFLTDCDFSSFSATKTRATRRGLSVTPDVFDRLVAAKSVRGDITWNELFAEAASLLESRYVTPGGHGMRPAQEEGQDDSNTGRV